MVLHEIRKTVSEKSAQPMQKANAILLNQHASQVLEPSWSSLKTAVSTLRDRIARTFSSKAKASLSHVVLSPVLLVRTTV